MLENKNMFDKRGIYLIAGKNGCGKTTFIKKLIKDKNWLARDKENLVSYVPQNRLNYQVKLKDFIDIEKAKYYIEKFSFKADKDASIEKLSGGEYQKLILIRAFLKNTPYIIMDEPTNSLDDKSIEVLKELLEEKRKNKTIIITTHDSRLNVDFDGIYNIENRELSMVKGNNNDENKKEKNQNNKIKLKFSNLILSSFNIFVVIIILAMISLITDKLGEKISFDIFINQKYQNDNYLELKYLSGECSDYSILKEGKCHNQKSLDNSYLNRLSKNDSIEKIFIIDDYKLDILESSKNKLEYFSIPRIMSDTPTLAFATPCSISALVKGRVTNDYESEVVISNYLANKFFNLHKDILNKEIVINDKVYKIVGISKYNTVCTSYNGDNKGVFEYNKKDYQQMVANKKEGYYDNVQADNIIIVFKEKINKSNLDLIIDDINGYQLAANYPITKEMQLRIIDQIPLFILIIVSCAVVLSIIILILSRHIYSNTKNYLEDIYNQNFNKIMQRKYVFLTIFVDILFIAMTTFIFSEYLFKQTFISCFTTIIILGIILFSILFFIGLRKLLKWKN